MPVSRTRPCLRCKREKALDDFRDPGQRLGRPPTVCRSCRDEDPVARARYEANVARREETRAAHARLAMRSDAEVEAAQAVRFPDGVKECPEVAGCGRTLPLSAFGPNRHQPSGLYVICDACAAEARALLENA